MNDAIREAFEAAHSHLSTASLRRNGGSTGCYTSATTAMSWAMWQESRKQALADAKQTNVTCQIYGHVVGACVECNTHIEKAPTIVPMTDGEITMTGHRIASKYTHRSDPTSHSYGFVKNTLIAFVREVEAHHSIK